MKHPISGQMTLEVSPDRQQHLHKLKRLAREKFAPRADQYDCEARFPHENFRDLQSAGLHAPTVPERFGGLGLGPQCGDPYTQWMMTKEIAKADLSMARCWEGHANGLAIIDGLADESQKQRWFEGAVQRGETWVAWSGEPQSRAPGEKARFGTTVTVVDGGFRVDGTKVFCSSAGGADMAVLLVSLSGPGGARHASNPDDLLLLGCPLNQPGISFDDSWWDPIGMRASVSHLARFDNVFIPKTDMIGEPGQYLAENWQTRFIPQYAASFLGAAEAALDYALHCIKTQKKEADPFIQQHIGQMAVNVETGHLWLKNVADLWLVDPKEAQLAGSRARHIMEHLAEDTVKRCIRACGARCLNRPSPLERIYRDLSFYVRHDNDDHNLAMIGKALLGLDFDASFYNA
ncbi:MAG: acyl-CoA dehydrogenase family protein [Acidobacteriota bacterium]|nr:acyl-CoA dehydrogenase family protein [Acidobacteriota bacterium]